MIPSMVAGVPTSIVVGVLLCYVCMLGYLVFLTSRCWVLMREKRNQTVKALSRLKSFFLGHYHSDLKVRELIARERVRCVVRYSHHALHYFAFCLILNLLIHLSFGGMEASVLTTWFADLIQILLHFLICAVFVAAPRLVTTRSIDFIYILFTAWVIIRGAYACTTRGTSEADPRHLASTYLAMLRCTLGVIVCNASVTGVCNIVLMVVHWIAIFSSGKSSSGFTHAYLLGQEFISTTFVVLVLVLFEHWAWAASRHMLEVKASSQDEQTVRSLLSALCDAVVTLGPDLRISSPAPKLANLLLQGRSTRALEGTLFLDFMGSTDQARFRDFLLRAPDHADSPFDPEPAQALNVHLRDSSGIAVQVQLFHSHFHDLFDKVGHLIGILEVGDSGGDPSTRVQSQTTNGGSGAPQEYASEDLSGTGGHMSRVAGSSLSPRSRRGSAAGDAGDSVVDSESETLGDSASVIISRNTPASPRPNDFVPPLRHSEGSNGRSHPQFREVSLVFDALRFCIEDGQTPKPVVDASLLEKESLQQWVAEWTTCRQWIQDLVNAVLFPVTPAKWPSRAGSPAALTFQVSFRGTCGLPPDILSRPVLATAPSTPTVVVPSTPPAPTGSATQTPAIEGVVRSNSSNVSRVPSAPSGSGVGATGAGAVAGMEPEAGTPGPPARIAVSKVRVAKRLRTPAPGADRGRPRARSRGVTPSLLGTAAVDREARGPFDVAGLRRLSHETLVPGEHRLIQL